MSATAISEAGGSQVSWSREAIDRRYSEVRAHTQALTAPLSVEDQCVQSMPQASPTKWHLAHTSWFFEAVVLRAHMQGYVAFDQRFFYLFNSYYESLGPRHPRPQRGLLTRPSLDQIQDYRRHVDKAMHQFFLDCNDDVWSSVQSSVVLGLHHEQQHQELLLTDILHAFSCNPLLPACQAAGSPYSALLSPGPLHWVDLQAGVTLIGHDGMEQGGFAFDNETPRHRVFLQPCQLADRLVTCGEYARFMDDGGYERPEFWLSDGWAAVQENGWTSPPYWLAPGDPRAPSEHWQVFGLYGLRPFDNYAPVSQLSFYEAAAYAEWAGARLPTEFEWEAAAALPGMKQMTSHVWQWTRSSYDPYPGFRPLTGAVREYNGKFMVGQLVLKGGSCATPKGHTRFTYRNFFPPAARWQFSGLRLARDC